MNFLNDMDFNNKRFTPYTDEFRSGTRYGVYDNERKQKCISTETIELARSKAIMLNENLEKIPIGLQYWDPIYGVPFSDQHLPATGSMKI